MYKKSFHRGVCEAIKRNFDAFPAEHRKPDFEIVGFVFAVLTYILGVPEKKCLRRDVLPGIKLLIYPTGGAFS